MSIQIGVDYYPEQWPEQMWEQDADRMKECGVKVVRMAEFAWSRMEPEEGTYDFEWLDRAVSVFADRRMQVVLCTPTCTPPLWVFEKYPEIIQTGPDGQRIAIGIRGHRCMNSPVYRTLCEKIIRQLVSRYRDNPAVIAYQIDNELEANHCRCEVCQESFQNWMRKKYRNVQEVNTAYGNSVWSGEYSSFSQVKPPMGDFIKWQNPSLTLDYNRYASESTVAYLEFQRTLIHSLDPDAWITTNSWLCENMPDFYDLFQNLDMVSYDNYPTTVLPESQEELYSHAFHLDLMRGIKQQNFWIMEQLSGAVGSWMPMSPSPEPGMIKGYALQAIAHGADTVVHFRWRTAVAGAEMYWHGILDHSDVPGRRYEEFRELCRIVDGLQEMDGSYVKNSVALLYSSDNEYGFKLQHQAEGMYYLEQLKSLHDGFTAIGVGVDIIDESADLSAYEIVLAPMMLITHEETEKALHEFAAQGGTILLTNRSGVKDSYNKCVMQPLPGIYRELVGARVREYNAPGSYLGQLKLTDDVLRENYKKSCRYYPGGEADEKLLRENAVYRQWCDVLEAETAQVFAEYGDRYYSGSAAVTRNCYGAGTVYYIGTVCDRMFYISLAKCMASEKKIFYYDNLPLGVEVTYRQKDEKLWRFVFNNTNKEQKVCLDSKTYWMKPFEMKISRESEEFI